MIKFRAAKSTKILFRIMFNTAFIQNGNYIMAGKAQLSPEKIKKDPRTIPPEFEIYLWFEDFCPKCDSYRTEIQDLCTGCQKELGPEHLIRWLSVKEICDKHTYPSLEEGKKVVRLDPKLVEELLMPRVAFNPDYYRVVRQVEESKEGIERRKTQPKLVFPV